MSDQYPNQKAIKHLRNSLIDVLYVIDGDIAIGPDGGLLRNLRQAIDAIGSHAPSVEDAIEWLETKLDHDGSVYEDGLMGAIALLRNKFGVGL